MLLQRPLVLLSAGAVLGAVAVAVAAPAAADPAVAGTYNSVAVTRIVSTPTGVGASRAKLAAGGTLTFNARSGLSATQAISAVDLTITAIGPTRPGYLSAYSGVTRPATSTLTFTAGEDVPNNAAVSVDATGNVSIYNGSTAPVDVAVDRNGYWTGGTVGTTGGAFEAVTPTRVADSRTSPGTPLAGKSSRDVTVTGAPDNASAVVVNIGAVDPTGSGYLTATGASTDQSADTRTSLVSFTAARSRVTLAYVPLTTAKTISLYNDSAASLNYTVDVFGYITSGTAADGGSIAIASPTRTADSRLAGGPIPGLGTTKVQVLPSSGPTTDVISAVIVNVTVTDTGAVGYLEAWNGSSPRPTTSITNFTRGVTRTGTAIVPLATDGSISLYNASSAPVSYIVDMQGLVVAQTPTATPMSKQRVAAAFTQARAVAAKNLHR